MSQQVRPRRLKGSVHELSYLEWQTFLRNEIKSLLRAFYAVNTVVALLVVILAILDYRHSWQPEVSGSVYKPLITERVVLALIGASAAQLGCLAAAAGTSMFKHIRDGASTST